MRKQGCRRTWQIPFKGEWMACVYPCCLSYFHVFSSSPSRTLPPFERPAGGCRRRPSVSEAARRHAPVHPLKTRLVLSSVSFAVLCFFLLSLVVLPFAVSSLRVTGRRSVCSLDGLPRIRSRPPAPARTHAHSRGFLSSFRSFSEGRRQRDREDRHEKSAQSPDRERRRKSGESSQAPQPSACARIEGKSSSTFNCETAGAAGFFFWWGREWAEQQPERGSSLWVWPLSLWPSSRFRRNRFFSFSSCVHLGAPLFLLPQLELLSSGSSAFQGVLPFRSRSSSSAPVSANLASSLLPRPRSPGSLCFSSPPFHGLRLHSSLSRLTTSSAPPCPSLPSASSGSPAPPSLRSSPSFISLSAGERAQRLSPASPSRLWGAGKGRAQQKKGPTRAGPSQATKNAALKKKGDKLGKAGDKEKDKKDKEKDKKDKKDKKEERRRPRRQTDKALTEEDMFSELTKEDLATRDLPHGLIPPLHWELYKMFGRIGDPRWPYTAEPATCKIFIERLFKGYGLRPSINEDEFRRRLEREWNFLAPTGSCSEFLHFDDLCRKAWLLVRDLKIREEEEEKRRRRALETGTQPENPRLRKFSLLPDEDIPRLTLHRRVNKEINQQGVHPAVLDVLWDFFSEGKPELTRAQASARFEVLVGGLPPEASSEDGESEESKTAGEEENEREAARDELDEYLEVMIRKRKEKERRRLLPPLTAERFLEVFQDKVEAAMEAYNEEAYWAYHRQVLASRRALSEAFAQNAAFRQQRRRFCRASNMLFSDIWRSMLHARNRDQVAELSRPTADSSVWTLSTDEPAAKADPLPAFAENIKKAAKEMHTWRTAFR
ncbi:putative transmembrane protein [Toxoplasma gondii TgCatPRC2]|uniref:Putative transmembrane protein n=2 Tax=Toxoplasma gondii TaxID=5811 RepID=A0A151HG96_TOXGO|nr:putative transmembrane protein [Toxoplasma gondii TgCatPRC2]